MLKYSSKPIDINYFSPFSQINEKKRVSYSPVPRFGGSTLTKDEKSCTPNGKIKIAKTPTKKSPKPESKTVEISKTRKNFKPSLTSRKYN